MKTVIKKRGDTEFKCSVSSICKYSDLVKVEVYILDGSESALTTCRSKESRAVTRKLINTLLHK